MDCLFRFPRLFSFSSLPIGLPAKMKSCLPWKSTGASVTARPRGEQPSPADFCLMGAAVLSLGQRPTEPSHQRGREVEARRERAEPRGGSTLVLGAKQFQQAADPLVGARLLAGLWGCRAGPAPKMPTDEVDGCTTGSGHPSWGPRLGVGGSLTWGPVLHRNGMRGGLARSGHSRCRGPTGGGSRLFWVGRGPGGSPAWTGPGCCGRGRIGCQGGARSESSLRGHVR